MNKKKNILPITLLTGYLGSGKTTLVNHILSNKKGIKFAVIVNDIGEVNIDASLIQKGGIVDSQDESLVALSNGCICCSLKMDLIKQITEITETNKFDYIIIEASGICEPLPIANTISSMSDMSQKYGIPEICRLDSIVTVVDALRLSTEFGCGENLVKENIKDDDLESLVIQQIEFCNIIILNKTDEVSKDELTRIKAIIKALQPNAEIIETNFAKVNLEKILNTNMFNMEDVSISAGWVAQLDRDIHDIEEEEKEHMHHEECSCGHHHEHHQHNEECKCGHHHEHNEHHCSCGHHHHGNEDEAEYGITTFVYYRRPAFNKNKFLQFVTGEKWSKNIIRSKGIAYFSENEEMSYMFEQAGVQKNIYEAGQWICTAPEDMQKEMLESSAELRSDWDEQYGDKMQKIVFIGQKMNRKAITEELDKCLER